MKELKGNSALSSFRIERLKEKIQAKLPEVGSISAQFIHFIDSNSDLSTEEVDKLSKLLNYGHSNTSDIANKTILITPRTGTISPWSSKATDILHNCGLKAINRIERGILYSILKKDNSGLNKTEEEKILPLLFDRMTEEQNKNPEQLFASAEPKELKTVPILTEGKDALIKANVEMGLAISADEIDYLYDMFKKENRDPSDVELLMFGQVNSEHCRHKIFNSDWEINGEKQDKSLFAMIRNTHAKNPQKTIIAYADNSGVMEGCDLEWFHPDANDSSKYSYHKKLGHIIMKVETHNHPTAICPAPGASTGVGGEIRDEGATGTGSKPKAGLAAFYVSNLNIPNLKQPWEKDNSEFPERLARPLDIMLEGPIGGASFGNEFGRPNILGQFRTLEETVDGNIRGYHKPIMAAGGMGVIDSNNVDKKDIPTGSCIVQLGGPSMLIGLGGGAASSMDSGSNKAELDFNSVQRDNPEMERRCQEVIDRCYMMDENNPILSIHDIGAGGLSNACPELIEDCGAEFEIRKVNNDEPSMSPAEIWCNESQERYMIAIEKSKMEIFEDICKRERCPYANIGTATGDGRLKLSDKHFNNTPIDIELGALLGNTPKMLRQVERKEISNPAIDTSKISIKEAVKRVLSAPAVADKTFLITIADRTVTGMVTRDQMVGPWQVPVADCAVISADFKGYKGSAMSMGDRTPAAILNAPASGRMAIGEALTNMISSDITDISGIKLSANWMAACGEEGEDAALFDTVKSVGMDLCPELGISIPVGKDSMSMTTVWDKKDGNKQKVVSPVSLLITAFSAVEDIRKTVTPELKPIDDSTLLFIDLGEGKNRLGASTLGQVFNQIGSTTPDLDNANTFAKFCKLILTLVEQKLIEAYHDRSDGGLLATISEMCFAGACGAKINLDSFKTGTSLELLFTEELGALIQVKKENLELVEKLINEAGISDITHNIGTRTENKVLSLNKDNKEVFSDSITELHRIWSSTTNAIQSLRDNPACAKEEYDNILNEKDPGLQFKLSFNPSETFSIGGNKPKIAVLREQGINGQTEMAAAFDKAGFESVDTTMTDLISGKVDLKNFESLVACGGFSYGDVLGAGSGWAASILYIEQVRDMFTKFFQRNDTITLGVCNGCQMISQIKELVPGAELWPSFQRNLSEQFEARFAPVKIIESNSVLFKDMNGSRLPIACAHGEGRVEFKNIDQQSKCFDKGLVTMQYTDNFGESTEQYPFNPNGSPLGITGLTTEDGRVNIMMPHPERLFRSVQHSYHPSEWNEEGPWLKLFRNARRFF